MIWDIQPNIPAHFTWYSHGKQDSDATCVSTSFKRNGVDYTNSYERSTAKFTFTAHTRKTESGLVFGGEEILLGHGIQMPASKMSHEDSHFGTMIWQYEKP